jgi:transcriptional regulator with XRE-family HTH domain
MLDYRDRAGLGREIARLRTQRRWSQDELARRVGMSQSAISRVEDGHRDLGALELFEIANALQTTADELLLEKASEPALLRAGGASSTVVAAALSIFDEAISDYFAAKALAEFL